MMFTVDLNREEANAGADLIRLTLLLPWIDSNWDLPHTFETIAIQTTYLNTTSWSPLQLYKVLSLNGTASRQE